jgi:formylglycine-generating enzyme required for sulfatase activity
LYISESREAITNSIGMKFVLIPEGKFVMGSPSDELGREDDERQHEVNISKSFYLQATEVSQRQWKKVMEEDNPSSFTDCGDDCPVEQVSWKDAQKFIHKLNEIEGTNKYRLPTEAEWEYACRSGTTTPFFTGKCISTDQANYDSYYPAENCPKGEYRGKTVKVGSFQPNAWGLYDMHGNVWEWCQDWYGDYPSNSVADPQGLDEGQSRVLRGGSWNDKAWLLRSANRYWGNPRDRLDEIGFRVARDF